MRSAPSVPVLLFAAILAGGLNAQPVEDAGVRTNLSYVSRQVFRGIERAGPSAQATVEYFHEGIRAGLWTNQPFASGEGSEVDVNLAFERTSSTGITLAAAATSFWYPDAQAGETRRSLEAGLTATLEPVGGVTPSLTYSHDFRLHADQLQLELTRSFALTSLGAFLDLSLFAGQVAGSDWQPDAPGPRRRDSYSYWGAEVHLPYRIGPRTTVIAGLHYTGTDGRSEMNGPTGLASRQNLWVSIGVSVDF